MFIKKLQILFLVITVCAVIILGYNWYINYQFNNNPLSKEIMQRIYQKELHLKQQAKIHYNINTTIPILISNKMPSRLFGAATTNGKKTIVYLNKKRFQESVDYMIDNVLPHEYAHAIMFKLGFLTNKNGGHTIKWQQICINLGGVKCDRFVNHEDILIGKLPSF